MQRSAFPAREPKKKDAVYQRKEIDSRETSTVHSMQRAKKNEESTGHGLIARKMRANGRFPVVLHSASPGISIVLAAISKPSERFFVALKWKCAHTHGYT